MKEILEALADALAFWRHPKDEHEELSDPLKGFRFQLLYGKDLLLWDLGVVFFAVFFCFNVFINEWSVEVQFLEFFLLDLIPCFLLTIVLLWSVFGSSLKWLINILGESLMF